MQNVIMYTQSRHLSMKEHLYWRKMLITFPPGSHHLSYINHLYYVYDKSDLQMSYYKRRSHATEVNYEYKVW